MYHEMTGKAAGKKSANPTGIPTALKNHLEVRSGFSFDDVRVHYNSSKPAQLQALAYTQGNQVYMGPGQERHLNHELWHVVQQKQGRVRPTMTIGGLPVNDDPGLEREADAGGSAQPAIQKKTAGHMVSNTIQCDWGEFIKGLLPFPRQLETLASAAAHPGTFEAWADLVNPARWRLNPLNIAAGIMNAREETKAGSNYHTSSRHGAHNTISNAMGRRNKPNWLKRQLFKIPGFGGRRGGPRDSDMWDHYMLTGVVSKAGTQGRFNSEMWERYAWNKAKECFEICAHNNGFPIVNWVGAMGRTHTFNTTLCFTPKWFGSSVGVSIGAAGARQVNGVKVAINYDIPAAGPANHLDAANGQMYPCNPTAAPIPWPVNAGAAPAPDINFTTNPSAPAYNAPWSLFF